MYPLILLSAGTTLYLCHLPTCGIATIIGAVALMAGRFLIAMVTDPEEDEDEEDESEFAGNADHSPRVAVDVLEAMKRQAAQGRRAFSEN